MSNYNSVDLLGDELKKLGCTREDFSIAGQAFVRFEHPVTGKHWTTQAGVRPSYPFMTHITKVVSKDKEVANGFARRLGGRIPVTLTLSEYGTDAERLLAEHGTVIVKPLDQHASRGVTLNITTNVQLEAAFNEAKKHSDTVMIQQSVNGREVRMTVLDGEVVSAIYRQTASIIGDGARTVRQLIDNENEQRRLLAFPHIVYPQIDDTMITEPISYDAVPTQGEEIQLSHSSMIGRGASLHEAIGMLHEDYKDLAVRFANELGTLFLVVDIIAEDPTRPMNEAGYAFIELNTLPALKMYSSVRYGKQVDVVAQLARLIIE